MINAERIEEMKRLSAEATHGQWRVADGHHYYDDDDIYTVGANGYSEAIISSYATYDMSDSYVVAEERDLQFIAESRQFVPDIIAAYEEQAEEIAKLREALEFYAEIGNYIVQGEGQLASSIVDDDLGASARDALK